MSEQARHTPGPWNVGGLVMAKLGNSTQRLPAFYIDRVGRHDGENCIAGIIPSGEDARLIAAAPELLEALQEIDGEMPDKLSLPICHRIRDIARAAITKATGGAQ